MAFSGAPRGHGPGSLAGASYARVEKTFGQDRVLVVLAVVVVALVVWLVRSHRSEHRADKEHEQEHLGGGR